MKNCPCGEKYKIEFDDPFVDTNYKITLYIFNDGPRIENIQIKGIKEKSSGSLNRDSVKINKLEEI